MSSYTITASDVTALNKNYCRLTVNNAVSPVSKGTVINKGDILKATLRNNKVFYYWNSNDGKRRTSLDFYSVSNGTEQFHPFELSDDLKTATCAFSDPVDLDPTSKYTKWEGLSVNTKDGSPYIVTQSDVDNLVSQNVTMKNGSENVVAGTVFNDGDLITAVCGEGYVFFTNSIYLAYRDDFGSPRKKYFNISGDNKTATITVTKLTNAGYDSMYVKTERANKPAYTITNSDYAGMVENGVTITSNGGNVVEGTELFVGDSLVAKAADGRLFYKTSVNPNVSIYMYWRDGLGQPLYKPFNISDDFKTATYTIELLPSGGYERLTALTEQVDVVTGNNNVYLIDKDILTQLNTDRFVYKNEQLYDYGQYILGLLQLPFAIDDSLILDSENITLADLKTKAKAPKISTDKIEVDLGKISIPEKFNNLLDYNNTNAILHLPRIDSINIDLDYVIGQTISIKYIIDCYNGTATVNISSSKINEVIVTKKIDMGVSIPMANVITGATTDNNNIDVGGDNGVKTPFIEIVKSEFIKADGVFTIPIIDEDLISKQRGFIKVENIDLNSKATKLEKEYIISTLNSGVIIK